jgi:AcrR family transcriptional regulator
MARPITISDQQIIEAARALVTERGMLATSQQIALRANVSEGTLFKRFRTKTQLLQTALGVEARQLSAPFEELARASGASTVANLREAGRAFIELRLRVESLAGSAREALSFGDGATKHRIVELVRAYIESEGGLQHVQPFGARAVALAFVSALFGLELSEGYERDLDQIMTLVFRDLAAA